MKRIIFFVSVCVFWGCESLLEEKPRALTVENFYNTADEVQSALAAIYPTLRTQFNGNYMTILECQSEYGGGFISSQGFDSHRMLNGLHESAINSYVTNVWNSLYQSVRNANLVIKYVPKSTVLSQEDMNAAIGEAKFMRAFTYFHLVRNWGGVPLYDEHNLEQSSGVAKSGVDDVYQLIVDDLLFAQDGLRDTPPHLGRPSKWAAKTLLADVYFFQGRYAEATELARQVMDSGVYKLEETTEASDFNALFGPEPNSQEEIFFFRYNANSTSLLPTYTLPRNAKEWFGGAPYGMFFITQEHLTIRTWDDADLRKSFTWFVTTDNRLPAGDPWYPYDSEVILAPKKYTAPGRTAATNPFPAYRYAYVLLLYAEAEARVAGEPTALAIEALNKVKRRAYGYPPQQESVVDYKIGDFASLESFINVLLKERGYEFPFEGKRWFDLVRTGKAQEIILEAEGRTVAEKAYLWPIPPLEMDLNEALTSADQNPGY